MQTKRCSKCKEDLPTIDYHVDRTLSDGRKKYRAECKYCVNKRHKQYNSEDKKDKQRQWKERVAKEGSLPYWNLFASKQNERCKRIYKSTDKITGKDLKELFEANPHCNYCGEHLSPKDFSPDHIVPLSKGGRNIISNIATSCWICNKLKSDVSREELFERVTRIYTHMSHK